MNKLFSSIRLDNDLSERFEFHSDHLANHIGTLLRAVDIMHDFILEIKNSAVDGVSIPVTGALIDHILARVAHLDKK